VPDLPASIITSERFGMDRMPDGTDGYFLQAGGAGVNPAYVALRSFTKGWSLGKLLKGAGVDTDPEEIDISGMTVESVNIKEISSNGLRQNLHNVMQFGQETLWTHGGYQYAVFISSDARVIAAKRQLPDGSWSTYDTGKTVSSTDLHCGAVLGVDPNGYIHVFYGFHNSPVSGHYMVSTNPGDIAVWTDKTQMTGSNEDSVSYVKCFKNSSYLFCVYRNGGSGDGEIYLNRYDHASSSWVAVQHPLINPVADVRNPYVSEVAVDNAGVFHIAWTWRENLTWGWVNKNVCYAKSENSGVTWKKSDGSTYTTPITFAASEVIDTADIGDGLINDPRIAVDSSNYPHVTYWRADSEKFLNYFHLWFDGSSWSKNQVTSFKYVREDVIPWAGLLSPLPLCRPTILTSGTTVIILFCYPCGGGQLYAATASSPYTSWRFHLLGLNIWGEMEPNFDKQYWVSDAKLHILASAPDGATGSISVNALETTPSSWGSGCIFNVFERGQALVRGHSALPYGPHGLGSRIRVYRATSRQTFPSDTWTKVEFNARTYDTLTEYDPTTNYRFVPKQNGYYFVHANIGIVLTVADNRYGIAIYKNASVITTVWLQTSIAQRLTLQISDEIYLAAGDIIEIFALQQTGSALEIEIGENNTFLVIVRRA
jgi:hypothetical protein